MSNLTPTFVGQPLPVILSSGDKAAPGVVYLRSWDQKARTSRAVKTLAMIWGIGAFCILFPIIHFFLPPLLFITGPIVASMLFRQSTVVLGGIGKCPVCAAEFEIVRSNYLKPHDEWPLKDTCGACREDVVIRKFK